MDFDRLVGSVYDEAMGRIQAAQAQAAQVVSTEQLPPPSTGTTFVISSGGQFVTATVNGTTNEIAITTVGTVVTFAFASGFFLKGYNDAAAIRGRIAAAAKASPAITGAVIPLAKITGGGADGSITVNAEGIVTAYVAPT